MDESNAGPTPCRRFLPALAVFLFLGAYLTIEGYRSFEGDQAYRLPILLHSAHPELYERDPFVRAFDTFNPHRGFLGLLGAGERVFGLSATLFLGFAAVFGLTGWSVLWLARQIWPRWGLAAGAAAFGLFLASRAGNLGTNHLFEPLLLDRLVAFALGWTALACFLSNRRLAVLAVPLCVFLAGLIHPSVGLQLLLWCLGGWLVGLVVPGRLGVSRTRCALGIGGLAAILISRAGELREASELLFAGMDRDAYYLITAFVQSPQHMIPHLWRQPQWLAGLAHLGLAGLVLSSAGWRSPDDGPPAVRRRFALMLALLVAGLAASVVGIEAGQVKLTLFQPFRMATVARGMCLLLGAGLLVERWRRGTFTGQLRAALLGFSVASDWAFVWAVGLEGLFSALEARSIRPHPSALVIGVLAACGWIWKNDPEQGQFVLLAGLGAAVLAQVAQRYASRLTWTHGRLARLTVLAWVVPGLAFASLSVDAARWPRVLGGIPSRIRLVERPADDLERLADWCRVNTPPDSVFVGPPGPKTFRLWSRRAVAFNRSGSPYHAAGIADWAARFQDHVGYAGDLKGFAERYLRDRQTLEAGFDALTPEQLVQLAGRQQADHLLVGHPLDAAAARASGLEHLRTEGRYAVYRVAPQPSLRGSYPQARVRATSAIR